MALHTGEDNNEVDNMQPSGAARLFQDQILQAAAGQTTTAEQSTTATGQLPGNPATSTTVPVMGHGMDVDVPSIAAFQNYPPAHIVATVPGNFQCLNEYVKWL